MSEKNRQFLSIQVTNLNCLVEQDKSVFSWPLLPKCLQNKRKSKWVVTLKNTISHTIKKNFFSVMDQQNDQ